MHQIEILGSIPQLMSKKLTEEKPPISEELKVLDSITLYKTRKWWSAVALIESFGRRQIALYLWLGKNEKWSRKEKFIVHSKAEWAQIKEAIEKMLPQLP